ncbi:MAG: hypothetical protein HY289_00575 [Planctomycetes bacterium]|nr:hypothetical protein [Planctomycetota bacterium]
MTKKDLQKWIENATWGMVAEYTVPWVAAASPHGREMALKWMASKDEAIASAGWGTYSSLLATKENDDLDLDEVKKLLGRVAESIHDQLNRVKYSMNNFVIAVGGWVKPLNKLAKQTALAIGPVQVDLVGACTIPYAPDQIKKMEARGTLNKKRKSPKC